MLRELTQWDAAVSSALLHVESIRACARYGPEYAGQAKSALERVALVPIDDRVLSAAAGLAPEHLRTLDALHLATAISLGDELGILLAYDQRLLDAARVNGVRALAPA